MEIVLNNTNVNLKEGIDYNKFLANRVISPNASDVKQVFSKYGYLNNDVNGAFVKFFTMDPSEISEVSDNLEKIDTNGLKDIFKNNLKLMYFKNKFIGRLEWCINNNVPYLNEDNTFAQFLNNEEDFLAYTSAKKTENKEVSISEESSYGKAPVREVPSYNQASSNVEQMSVEDRQVYNDVVKRLNYLVLENPMDTMLALVVKNITNNIQGPIISQVYKQTSIGSMLLDLVDVIGSNLNLDPRDIDHVRELVSGAFAEEEKLGRAA